MSVPLDLAGSLLAAALAACMLLAARQAGLPEQLLPTPVSRCRGQLAAEGLQSLPPPARLQHAAPAVHHGAAHLPACRPSPRARRPPRPRLRAWRRTLRWRRRRSCWLR